MAPPEFRKGGGHNGGLRVKPPAVKSYGILGRSHQLPTNFYGFHIKKYTHFNTLSYRKRLAVSVVIMGDAKIFSQLMSKSKSLAKISERRLQALLV